MYPDVILLNGTGSSGKTSVAKELQELLEQQYLNFSIDSVLYALPPSDLKKMIAGQPIERGGYDYAQLVEGYHKSVRGLLQAGCKLVIDNAWVDNAEFSNLLQDLQGFSSLIIGVECELDVCKAREIARGDRAIGLAEYEFPLVHKDKQYDYRIDTSHVTPMKAAQDILRFIQQS